MYEWRGFTIEIYINSCHSASNLCISLKCSKQHTNTPLIVPCFHSIGVYTCYCRPKSMAGSLGQNAGPTSGNDNVIFGGDGWNSHRF